MEIFAKRLKEERELNHLSYTQMAALLGVSATTYFHYESINSNHREPPQEMLVKIATVLNTTVDFLLGKDPI